MALDPVFSGSDVLDDLPVPLWVGRAPDGLALFANRAAREILGQGLVPKIGIEGTPAAYGIFDRQGRPYPVEGLPFSRVMAERASVVVDDLAIHRPDGSRVCVRAFGAPYFDEAATLRYVVISFMDVTQEMHALAAQKTVEERLAFAIKHAPILLWMTDRDGVVTLSDGAALQRLGFAPGELVGRSVFDLYRDDSAAVADMRRTLAGESIARLHDTDAACMHAYMAPLRDPDGALAGLIGVATDLTESRRLERQLIQDDRVRAVGALAASVAHEINNPLTYVSANVEVAIKDLRRLDGRLRDAEDLPAAVRDARSSIGDLLDALESARTGSERVARITRELRTFARGGDEPGAVADVGKTIRAVLDLVAKEVETRARLAVHVAPGLHARISESRLVQVLLNLLMNASQAMPEADPARHIVRVSARGEADRVVIEVADSGPGVPRAERERVFEPFVTTKPVGVGTGLGLFVCRNIVQSASGEIAVDDAPGGGALFRVTLPASEPAARVRSTDAAAGFLHGHVLIVDDDRLVARGLASALQREGISVAVIHDGREAIEALVNGAEVDLAYCDVVMNGLTGVDVYEELARRAPARLNRLVMMTGGAFTPRARAFVETHEDAVVHKPFDIVGDARRRLTLLRRAR